MPSFPIQFSFGLVFASMIVSVLTGLGFRIRARLVGVAPRSGHGTEIRVSIDYSMRFREIIAMALQFARREQAALGLTMIGITIGVFSVISVMTAIGALQYSIESGISFLGSNIFQFAKYPANVSAGRRTQRNIENRRNITYPQALRY